MARRAGSREPPAKNDFSAESEGTYTRRSSRAARGASIRDELDALLREVGNAARRHVLHLVDARPQQQRGGDRAAVARGARDRERLAVPPGQLLGKLVVRDVERPLDVALPPLVVLADVEQLHVSRPQP